MIWIKNFILKQIHFIIFFLISFISVTILPKKADLIVFSFDRPLQLYSALESIRKYISNTGDINIVYRVSDDNFLKAYDKVKEDFSGFNFYKQNRREDFKDLLINLVFFRSFNDYILFTADDVIVKDYIDLSSCITYLIQANAYGFYLRLGMNINECYMLKMETKMPEYTFVAEDVYSIIFNKGKGDWTYPNSVDMTIYKKDDIKNDILKVDFFDPNSLEYFWNNQSDFNKKGLFFKESKIINIPLNLVNQSYIKNRSMNLFSTKELLDIFNNGFKIDIDKFYKIKNNAPHVEVKLDFIPKK